MINFPLKPEEKDQYSRLRDMYKSLKGSIVKSNGVLNAEMCSIDTEVSSVFNFYEQSMEKTTSTATDLQKRIFDDHINTKKGEFSGQIKSMTAVYTKVFTDLTNLVNESRPSIPGAEQVCIPCDMKSVFFVSRLPVPSEPDMHYECALCGRNNLSDYNRYDKKE